MIHYSIDRFEGDFAVCESSGGEFTDILISLLPAGAREGDILVLAEDGKLMLDAEETQRRRDEILRLQADLFE